MKLRNVFLAVVVLAVPLSSASAHEVILETILSGPAEAPPNASPGNGFARVTLDLDLVTMRLETSFADLLGTVTQAHIHAPTLVAGAGTANVATEVPSFTGFPLGVTSGTYDHTFDLTVAGSYNPAFITSSGGTVSDALNALIFALEEGKAYLNIHTSAFPGGEIRGFLTVVPEPGTWALLACGAAGIGLVVRRRRGA